MVRSFASLVRVLRAWAMFAALMFAGFMLELGQAKVTTWTYIS